MIPIVLKEFQWNQNPEWVLIVVPVKGVKTSSTDIVTSPNLLKLSSPPFIFELFLAHEVEEDLGECRIDERAEQVSFRLKKVGSGQVWEELQRKDLNKEEKAVIRKEAVEWNQRRSDKEKEEKHKRRFDRKQATVHDQIRLDSEAKERISCLKTLEGQKALATVTEITHVEEEQNSKKDIFSYEDLLSQAYHLKLDKKADVVATVDIRPSVCIPVQFSPRHFPTPSRESTHADEQEWLKKQTEARKLSGFVDEDLRPEERNPEWLLDKGLSLMRTESYLGAISAFSLGIRLAPKMAELFVERAGAHLAVKNYHRTVKDCSQALELLTPKVAANAEDRYKCHLRRCSAFRGLSLFKEALADVNQAILLKPEEGNEELAQIQTEIKMDLRKEEEKAKGGGGDAPFSHRTSTSPHDA